jgi:glutamine cyclotransferase
MLSQPELIRKIEHDRTSFTEGLEALPDDRGFLESAGLYNESRLLAYSEVDGELYSCNVDRSVFGEGITMLGGKLYQLTYKENKAFVYDFEGTELTGCSTPEVKPNVGSQFNRKEGWGMTNDGQRLIASDGSAALYVMEPGSMNVSQVLVVGGMDPTGGRIFSINELEFVNGLIYFNIWYKNFVGVYNMSSNEVVAWIDLSELVGEERRGNAAADVLNGIAFTRPKDPKAPRKLVVTGKLWRHLYVLDHEPLSGR